MDFQPLDILKWVGLVLAAGFIGYFGRYLAMLILERLHKRESQSLLAPGAAGATPPGSEVPSAESKSKLNKKKAKAEIKRAKKAQKS